MSERLRRMSNEELLNQYKMETMKLGAEHYGVRQTGAMPWVNRPRYLQLRSEILRRMEAINNA